MIEHGTDFLSRDQEVRIRKAAEGLIAAPEALLYSADCLGETAMPREPFSRDNPHSSHDRGDCAESDKGAHRGEEKE